MFLILDPSQQDVDMRWTVNTTWTWRRGSTVVLTALALATSVGAAGPTAAAVPVPKGLQVSAAPSGVAPARAVTVTLLTGDRVRVMPVPGGEPALQVAPGLGRDRIGFVREAHVG